MDFRDDDQSFALPKELDRRISKNGKIQGIVRLDPSYRIDRGDPLYLKPDTNNLHLFDPKNGESMMVELSCRGGSLCPPAEVYK
jgi:hypothetical protein